MVSARTGKSGGAITKWHQKRCDYEVAPEEGLASRDPPKICSAVSVWELQNEPNLRDGGTRGLPTQGQ